MNSPRISNLAKIYPASDGLGWRVGRVADPDGAYQRAGKLPFSDEQWDNVDPVVAQDESFWLESPPTAPNDSDLFIVFHQNSEWGMPEHLDQPIHSPTIKEIEPRLAPDGHTLFFSSRRVVPREFPGTSAQALRALER